MVDHISGLYPMDRFFDFPQSAGRKDETTDLAVINSILNDFGEARPNLAPETSETMASVPTPELHFRMPEGVMDAFSGAEVMGDSGNDNPLDQLDYQVLPQVSLAQIEHSSRRS